MTWMNAQHRRNESLYCLTILSNKSMSGTEIYWLTLLIKLELWTSLSFQDLYEFRYWKFFFESLWRAWNCYRHMSPFHISQFPKLLGKFHNLQTLQVLKGPRHKEWLIFILIFLWFYSYLCFTKKFSFELIIKKASSLLD